MKTRKVFAISCCILPLFFSASTLMYGQVRLSGASCVTSGIEYQYIVNGNWTTDATSQVCVQGGVLAHSDSTCRNVGPLDLINIVWDSAATEGLVTLHSPVGDTSFQVKIAAPLKGGDLDIASRQQIIDSNSIPNTLHCSLASGGNCSPYFAYQWQQSSDNVNWTDIEGATDQHLSFSAPIIQNRYFRRKVTEVASTSIGYSDGASILIHEPLGFIRRGETERKKVPMKNIQSNEFLLAAAY